MGGRTRREWALAAAALLVAPASAADADSDVRAAFEAYRSAAAARDGRGVVALVTAGSAAHYAQLRRLALSAPRSEVEALSAADRLMVLRLRHEFTAAELRPLSGADLIRIGIEEAWASPKVLAPLAVAAVDVSGDRAILHVERAGEVVPLRFPFLRESGTWKLDLVDLARGADAALTQTLAFRANRAKVSVDEVMRWVIEDTSGHLVDHDLWRPLDEEAR